MAYVAGTRLGTYEIVGPLGAGGMGEVYRAKDLRLGREIALKVLPEAFTRDADHLARFEREARTVAGLNHPNIVTLFSFEDEDEIRFLTMELIEGQSLASLVVPGGLPLARVIDLGVEIADALTAAHERGVVHRDLKPANVMVTREGRVKVLDFGLARTAFSSQADTQELTAEAPISRPGVVVGTAPYMAPEQIRGEVVDARTDLFAFGVVLYELLAGRRPFAGSNAMVVAAAILKDAPEPLTRDRNGLPADLERIVGRCLEKDPRKRAQSALDLCNELRRLRNALEGGGPPAPTVSGRIVPSIAVLPFVNRSRDTEDEYFSDGIADELLNVLAKIGGLRVAARTSAFQFKGRHEDVALIGRQLNVATLLEGSVRKSGNRVRISVQLVKVEDGYHLWSESYDRTLDDIFAVQDDIAQSVVKELRTTLLGEEPGSRASGEAKAEVAMAARGRGTNAEAHRLCLLARHLLNRFVREDVAIAVEYLHSALALDPESALAWAELSRAHTIQAGRGFAPAESTFVLSKDANERSLALAPDLPEGLTQRAWLRAYADWDWRGAAESMARALDVAPGSELVLRRAAALAMLQGRAEEATELNRRSLELDPMNAGPYHNLGMCLATLERFEEAEGAFRKALEFGPGRSVTHGQLAVTLLELGRGGEAIEVANLEPYPVVRLSALAIVHHGLGQPQESDAALQAMVMHDTLTMTYNIAEVYAARGEVDRAFEWLERAFEERDSGLAEMKVGRHLRSLHGDPRWEPFLRKVGLL